MEFNSRNHVRKQTGAAILIITVILLVAALLSMMYAAKNSLTQQKSSSNVYSNNQAFEAGEAGLEFGIQFLTNNVNTITASASGGFINYGPTNASITNVALSNGCKYSIVYTNPTQNNYDLILIKSTGVSADGTSTHIVQQYVDSIPSLSYAATTLGNFSAAGSGTITGGSNAVDAGGTITTAGWNTNSETLTPNDPALSSLTAAQLFSNTFNLTEAQMQAQSTVYTTPGSVPWSTMTGDIWYNNNLSLAGNYTVGTLLNPVLLIVNGNFSIAGRLTMTGILFVIGSISAAGNIDVNGALVSTNGMSMAGSLAFNESVVKALTSGAGAYIKVPGSWKDY